MTTTAPLPLSDEATAAIDAQLPSADPAQAAELPLSFMDMLAGRLGDLYQAGGPVVALIIALSVMALAMCLLKLYQFQRMGIGGAAKCTQKALTCWQEGEVQAALSAVEGKKNPAAETLHAVMRLSLEGAAEAIQREEAERVASASLFEMRRYLRALEVITQCAPLLGLFGTVLGMIEAFRTLQSAGSTVDPSLLAGGIWVALLTTAAGLALAIPLSLFLAWLETVVARQTHLTEQLATRFFTQPQKRPVLHSIPTPEDGRRAARAH